jgi:hypothetical protein
MAREMKSIVSGRGVFGGRVPPSAWAVAVVFAVGCGHAGGEEARYPSRPPGCAVRRYPEKPTIPVDELGGVRVECASTGSSCERQLLDAVCARGGDVAWGMGENALSSGVLVAQAAHSKRLAQGARERGCAVRTSELAPPAGAENIGPVVAVCSPDDSRDTCLRELEDQACLLGGDYLWQIEGPTPYGDKQRWRGRAAYVP